jgi:hypothetical protein
MPAGGKTRHVAETTEEAVLRALRAKEGLFFRDQGLMTKEVAEQTGLSLGEAQRALNDPAHRGLVHRLTSFWNTGEDPEPDARRDVHGERWGFRKARGLFRLFSGNEQASVHCPAAGRGPANSSLLIIVIIILVLVILGFFGRGRFR